MTDDASPPLPTNWPTLDDPKLLDRILDIVAEEAVINRASITPEATLEGLGLESIDVVSILTGVEEKLDTYLPMDNNLASARNFSEFVAAVASAVQANKSTPGPA